MSDNLTPRIEQLAPELEKIISTSEPIQHLADGFGGAQGPGRGTAVVGGRRLPLVQRHPQQPSHEVPAIPTKWARVGPASRPSGLASPG